MRSALFILLTVSVVYSALLIFVFFRQGSLLYFPTYESKPATTLAPWIVNGRLIGYAREVPNPPTRWLLFHGNGGQAADRDYVLPHLAPTDSLYVLEYPGYGLRDGSPSRESINAAAFAAYEYLRTQNPGTPLAVIGESIGSGPACELARLPAPPEKIVLLTPFDTLANVAAGHFQFLPVRLLLRDRWDNIEALRDYRGPVEIFAARHDTIIPHTHASALAGSRANTVLHIVPGGHNDWSQNLRIRIAR